MTYEETIQYLINATPLFQNVGTGAYKEGLSNTNLFDKHFNFPHKSYHTIHIAGTNGKGSCAHTLAAILQEAGYKVGLYTSPHLIDFRERIRVNGIPVSEKYVIDFVENEKPFFEPLHPSFFELTTAMAFAYFKKEQVDVAVIEVGLGGRLDCTNIISPDLSIITNISFDHMALLGDTLTKIASEKAGIIKKNIPVIIGEYVSETRKVFQNKADEVGAPIIYAQEQENISSHHKNETGGITYQTTILGKIDGELAGDYQVVNTNTILTAIFKLQQIGYHIKKEDIQRGFANVCKLTGLQGRWQILHKKPTIVCDTGHNEGGWKYLSKRLKKIDSGKLRIVFGMVNDKDISAVLSLMPKNAEFYFTKASVKRALNEQELAKIAYKFHLSGCTFPNVATAINQCIKDASPADFIFVGGSTFIVADLLTGIQNKEIRF